MVHFIDPEYGYVDFLEFDMALNRKMSKTFNVHLPRSIVLIFVQADRQTDRQTRRAIAQ